MRLEFNPIPGLAHGALGGGNNRIRRFVLQWLDLKRDDVPSVRRRVPRQAHLVQEGGELRYAILAARTAETRVIVAVRLVFTVDHHAVADMNVDEVLPGRGKTLLRGFSQQR